MPSVTRPAHEDARQGGAVALAAQWRALRAELLAAYEAFWPEHERVAQRTEWNLPLWELGHVAWFAERWTLRQGDRHRGERADPSLALPPGRCRDDFYDSSAVPHAARWSLALPDRVATLALLEAQLHDSLAGLREAPHEDAALYPFRLSLMHEAMHVEAARLLVRGLGLPTPTAAPWTPEGPQLQVAARRLRLGSIEGAGFAFDNELQGLETEVGDFTVDATVRRWRDLLPWRRSRDWHDVRLWSAAGNAWRLAQGGAHEDDAALDPDAPAEGLSGHEAEAWCRWAGRRLLGEAEWMAAAATPGFVWGELWEWTAEAFAPFPGFRPHPYRDYSAPWFDGAHRLLKGASRFTPALLRDTRFRNFYRPERRDLLAGLRSAAPAA